MKRRPGPLVRVRWTTADAESRFYVMVISVGRGLGPDGGPRGRPRHPRRHRAMPTRKAKTERDVTKAYPLSQFADKLRRLADAVEGGERFRIQVAGERVSI